MDEFEELSCNLRLERLSKELETKRDEKQFRDNFLRNCLDNLFKSVQGIQDLKQATHEAYLNNLKMMSPAEKVTEKDLDHELFTKNANRKDLSLAVDQPFAFRAIIRDDPRFQREHNHITIITSKSSSHLISKVNQALRNTRARILTLGLVAEEELLNRPSEGVSTLRGNYYASGKPLSLGKSNNPLELKLDLMRTVEQAKIVVNRLQDLSLEIKREKGAGVYVLIPFLKLSSNLEEMKDRLVRLRKCFYGEKLDVDQELISLADKIESIPALDVKKERLSGMSFTRGSIGGKDLIQKEPSFKSKIEEILKRE